MVRFLKNYIKRKIGVIVENSLETANANKNANKDEKKTPQQQSIYCQFKPGHLDDYGLISKLTDNQCLVKTRFGRYLVVPSYNIDVAIGVMRDGIIEPWTTAVVSSILKPGDKYVDVGANFGYYSVLGASLVQNSGKVYAIEANPEIFVYLILSCYWSGCVNIIEPYNFAAYYKDNEQLDIVFDPQFIGCGSIILPEKNTKSSIEECLWTGSNIQENLNAKRKFVPLSMLIATYTKFSVPGYTIDHILSDVEDVKLLHMDVESSESFVIGGAKNLIRRSPQINLIIEWDPKYSYDVKKKQFIDDMWTFLLEEMQLTPYRIEPENYPGIGQMPNLCELNKESLFNVPHSDILLKRIINT
jgi:FkbM family methyltransferase